MKDDKGTAFPASEATQGQKESRRSYQELQERLGEFGWWQDYLALRQQGWDWRKAVFIAWAASPVNGRSPETQAELATQVLGLRNDRTIRKWREKQPEIDHAIAACQAAPLLRHRRDIFDALVTSARDPDFRHHSDRKLALELLGDYKPKSQHELVGEDGGPVEQVIVYLPDNERD